jgi:hypothetical protein
VTSRNLTKRLQRLESRLTPPPAEILQITVTRIGQPDRIVELRLHPAGRRVVYGPVGGDTVGPRYDSRDEWGICLRA